jgi:hypothetical protein
MHQNPHHHLSNPPTFWEASMALSFCSSDDCPATARASSPSTSTMNRLFSRICLSQAITAPACFTNACVCRAQVHSGGGGGGELAAGVWW